MATSPAVLDRRKTVVTLLRDGRSQAEIANILDVSESTISRDVATIAEVLDKEIAGRVSLFREAEIAKLDELEQQAIENYETAMDLRDSEDKIVNSAAWDRYDKGANRWWAARLQIAERRSKLLNLDLKPKQNEQPTGGGVTFIFESRVKNPQPLILEAEPVVHED
jgi:predicted transcriptional regulator